MKNKEVAHGEEFVKLMLDLEADELCALSKILGVRLLTDEINPETKKAIPRDGVEILEDCIDHFAQRARPERRWLIKYLKKNKQKK